MSIPLKPTHSPLATRLAAIVAILTALGMPMRVSGVAVEQTLLGLALILALVLLAIEPGTRQRVGSAVWSHQGRAVGAIFAAWAITVWFSIDPMGSMEIGGRTGLFILGAVVVWAAIAEHKETHRLLWKVLLLSAVILAALSVLSLSGLPKLKPSLIGKIVDPDHPHLYFKAFAALTMCLIPVVAWAGRQLGGKWRWWGYAFAPLALAVILLTHNRSALAGLIAMTIAGIVLLALAKRRHTKAMIATAIAAAGGIVAWVATREAEHLILLEKLAGKPMQVATYLPSWLLDPHRQNIWKFTFERFLDHPWVGNGIDQLNRLPGAKMSVPGLENSAALIPSHPHNWALEILGETGLIGFLPVVIVLAFIAWRLARRYLQDDNEADLTLFTLMAGFWASSLFNFSIWAVWWQLVFFMLFAIVAATRPKT